MHSLISKLETAIRVSFYALFFLVPLTMWPDTFELFEFNKMWVVFGISTAIFLFWGTKMIIEGQFRIRRTPLDIPILLFLLSQIISTVTSMEPHTSLWGYYSRFNGGLFSTISYIFLYYAFATNILDGDDEKVEETDNKSFTLWFTGGILTFFLGGLISSVIGSNDAKMIVLILFQLTSLFLFLKSMSGSPFKKSLLVTLTSGLLVVLWGLPSHFGLDPTCLVFRGTFDTKCWTEQFQPTVRIFSTLGQPNWMGTYLAALLPLSLGLGIKHMIEEPNKLLKPLTYLGLALLFFLGILYTRSQSSFVGLALGLFVFGAFFAFTNFKKIKNFRDKTTKYVIFAVATLALTVFFIGTPIQSLDKYVTLKGLTSIAGQQQNKAEVKKAQSGGLENDTNIQLGGTESSKIRLIVWKGALELFKQRPLFGTGVETYAFAYYKVKPVEHNLTSEWDFLYNKAHNEYLNYLATTGAFGLGTHLLIIVLFLYTAGYQIFKRARKSDVPVLLGILAGYIAILVSNFFGFSVVIINLFFFILPLFFLQLANPKVLTPVLLFPKEGVIQKKLGFGRALAILAVVIISAHISFRLLNFWAADRMYAFGYNLNKGAEFTQAYTPLDNAVKLLPSEDLYRDEQSINLATLAVLLAQNNRATEAAGLAQRAKSVSDEIVSRHPNNIVFYKTRIRVQYALAQLDPAYIDAAIETAKYARTLAPTDAKLAYNLALFYNQRGDNDKMIELLNVAIKLKPNYFDPYYAKALLYQQLAKENPSKASEYRQDAKKNLEYILKYIDPASAQAKDLLKTL